MYCKNCGAMLVDDDQKFCKECGAPQQGGYHENVTTNSNYSYQDKPRQSKCWSVFAGVGLGLGIAGLAMFWFPLIGFLIALHGLVFSILGMKSYESKGKAITAFVFSLIATVIGFIITANILL